MKSAARHILIAGGLALSVTFGLALTARAQNREKYLISAKAGGVNHVTGSVMVRRKGERSERALSSTDELWTGDRVTTGVSGRVEVLLNPGSYMRVAENSEFELTDASLDNLLVTLLKGSAVVEVTGGDNVELALGINTSQAETLIVKGGIYRFNALPNDTTEVVVSKGRAIIDKATPSRVKGGRKVIIRGQAAEVAKVDKKNQDTLDLWSKERAKTLAHANRRLERSTLWTAFNDYTWGDMSRWGQISPRFGSLGLWVLNSRTGIYCFLPTGPTAWSSPYGHRYGNGFMPYGIIPEGWPHNNGNGNWSGTIVGHPRGGGVSNGGGGNGGNITQPQPQPQPMPQPMPQQPTLSQPVRQSPADRQIMRDPNR